MPYPFAHPAAVIPLARFGVPSALVIGSIVPDLWYFVPWASRHFSHSLAGLALFCLPVGALLYLVFHLVLKQALIALLSTRLGAFTPSGLPSARWRAVTLSLAAGALTHLGWDGLTHSNSIQGHNWVQHVNTALGTLVLVAWLWHKLRNVQPVAPELSLKAKICVTALLAAGAACGAWLVETRADIALRHWLRSEGIAAAQGLFFALLAYCALWQLQRKIPLRGTRRA